MKIKYLGTGAAEGIPALFCNCDTCNIARKEGGKNIRSRSQMVINDDLLIDFGPDTFRNLQLYNIRADKIKHLLVTHSHLDHFDPTDLAYRGLAFGHKPIEENLHLYGNEQVVNKFRDFSIKNIHPRIAETIKEKTINVFEKLSFDDYEVYPLKARHMVNEQALFYLIKTNGKTLLYGNDTGVFFDEVFEYLKKLNMPIDFVSLDCTEAFNFMPNEAYHMGFNGVKIVTSKLSELNLINENTPIYLTHFSHNGKSLHNKLNNYAKNFGWKIAFDGLELEI